MKRGLIIPFVVIALVAMACSMTGKNSKPTESKPTATQPIAQVTKETIPTNTTQPEEPIIEEPSEPIVEEPTQTTAPEPTATEAPTNTPPGPFEFTDTFDRNSQNWSQDLIVTTQTSGRDVLSKAVIQDGMLSFRFEDKETYMYKFLNSPVGENVSVLLDYQSGGHINNGIAIVCRVNDERTTWYEARVSSTSDYALFLYDKSRKTEEGKNPYLLLGKGKLKIDELAPTKPNTIKLTCLDDEMILDLNKGKRVINQILETQLSGSSVGLGAMSFDVLPIRINFDQVTIRGEE